MKRIGILPNIGKDENFIYTKQLVTALSDDVQIYMENIYADSGVNAFYTDSFYQKIDVLIVLGGDGTILQAAEPCAEYGIPILGINLGRVGFMSEIETNGIDSAVSHLIKGDFVIEKRMMLKAECCSAEHETKTFYALNDIVISKPPETTLVYCSMYADGEKVNSYTADGMIVATPTGSTGYSLSAGGPVADPCTELFIATPICAHRLSARSAVLSADKELLLKLDNPLNKNIIVSIDGKSKAKLNYGDKIAIKKSEYITEIIKIGKQSFYDTLVQKLS